ncbi:hypothetical protein DL96DRAFT_1670480 [Flagelloscypha sp. PMI_526]|nr:hypothetical protein DL96DRAFT_1670480 [Flagelloscypha sp. PMI_526]
MSPKLPAEVLTQVLHSLYSKQEWGREPNYPDLLRYALVCKAWSNPAQLLLFRYITNAKAAAFYQLFSPSSSVPRASELLQHVRVLEVSLAPLAFADEEVSAFQARESITQEQLRHLIRVCPHLYELPLVKEGIGLRIQALHVQGYSVQSPIVCSLLQCLPNVQFLTVGSEVDALWSSEPPPQQLYELVLHRTPPSDQLKWVMSSSLASLRVLELRDLPGTEMMDIMAPCLPFLLSLRLINYNSKCASFLEKCTSLQDLTLWNLPTVKHIEQLPQTLEHFAFVSYSFTAKVDLRAIATLIETLPKLILNSDYVILQDTCKRMNVELRPDFDKFWPAEYPIKTRRFPRRRSVSNFYLMHNEEKAIDATD